MSRKQNLYANVADHHLLWFDCNYDSVENINISVMELCYPFMSCLPTAVFVSSMQPTFPVIVGGSGLTEIIDNCCYKQND
jgi:hypothetical protein